MKKAGLLSVASALLLLGCRSEPVTWRTPLHGVIFLNDTLTWDGLVADTLWTLGDDGLELNASGQTALFDSDVLLPNLDTSWTSEFVLPFIGGPIPIAPGAEIWSEVESVNLSIPEVDLRRIRMGAGAMVLTASSTVQGPLELQYSIDGAIFPASTNGGSNEVVLQLSPDAPAQFTLPLAGVELDLDGDNNLLWSKLTTSWSVGVPSDVDEDVGLFGSDMLTLNVAFVDLELAQVEGRFGSRTLTVEESVTFDGLFNVQDLQVAWSSLELGVNFINSAGIDFGMSLDEVIRTDGGPDSIQMALEDPALTSSVLLPRAVVNGEADMAGWEIDNTSTGFVLGTGSTSLPAFLSSIPDEFLLKGTAEINPLGDVSGGYDRIDLQRLPEIEWTIKAPLNIGPARAVWVDTLSPKLPDGIEFDGDLNLTIENSLPVGVQLALSWVDVPEVLQLFDESNGATSWFSYPLIEVAPGSGVASEPSFTEVAVPFLPIQFSALRMGARLQVHSALETPPEGAAFDVTQQVIVRGHLDGDAILSVQ